MIAPEHPPAHVCEVCDREHSGRRVRRFRVSFTPFGAAGPLPPTTIPRPIRDPVVPTIPSVAFGRRAPSRGVRA